MTDRELLKEARDLIVMCSLIDKSGQCEAMADRIDKQLSNKRFYKVYYNTFADEVLECLIEAISESNARHLFYKQGEWAKNANIERVINVC